MGPYFENIVGNSAISYNMREMSAIAFRIQPLVMFHVWITFSLEYITKESLFSKMLHCFHHKTLGRENNKDKQMEPNHVTYAHYILTVRG